MSAADLIPKLADRLQRASACTNPETLGERWLLVADTIDLLIQYRLQEARELAGRLSPAISSASMSYCGCHSGTNGLGQRTEYKCPKHRAADTSEASPNA
jgi:hypothetical protein